MTAQNRKSRFPFASGPLGAWGRRLGFRWVFPIGTLPVPFHPLVLPLALVGILAWTVRGVVDLVAGNSTVEGWPGLLVTAGLLGLGMSVPILSWMLMALGGRVIQAFLILAAVVLIAAEGVAQRGVWQLAVATGFFGLWIVQAIVGRLIKRQLLARWQAFQPAAVADRPVVVDHNFTDGTPIDWMHRLNFSEVWEASYSNNERGRGYFRLDDAAAGEVRKSVAGAMPDGWKLVERKEFSVLEYSGPLPADAIRLTHRTWKCPLGALAPGLVEITVDDGDVRSLVVGAVQPVLPLPFLELFHWTAIFGGKSQWRVGFVYGKGERIGALGSRFDGVLLMPEAARPVSPSRLDALLSDLAAGCARCKEAFAELKLAVTEDPEGYTRHRQTLGQLQRAGPDLLGEDAGPFLLDWLHRARDARKRDGVIVAAGLIAKLSDEAFAALTDELFHTLNSRKLALEWELVPGFDPTPLPKETPRFGNYGGFGLIFRQPKLFIRLGEIHPPLRPLLNKVATEMKLPKDVAAAMARWDIQHADEQPRC